MQLRVKNKEQDLYKFQIGLYQQDSQDDDSAMSAYDYSPEVYRDEDFEEYPTKSKKSRPPIVTALPVIPKCPNLCEDVWRRIITAMVSGHQYLDIYTMRAVSPFIQYCVDKEISKKNLKAGLKRCCLCGEKTNLPKPLFRNLKLCGSCLASDIKRLQSGLMLEQDAIKAFALPSAVIQEWIKEAKLPSESRYRRRRSLCYLDAVILKKMAIEHYGGEKGLEAQLLKIKLKIKTVSQAAANRKIAESESPSHHSKKVTLMHYLGAQGVGWKNKLCYDYVYGTTNKLSYQEVVDNVVEDHILTEHTMYIEGERVNDYLDAFTEAFADPKSSSHMTKKMKCQCGRNIKLFDIFKEESVDYRNTQ